MEFTEKTTGSAGMTSRAMWVAFQNQGILIAIHQDLRDLEDIARAFSFLPKPPTGTGVKMRKSGFARFRKCFRIHECNHQYAACFTIRDHRSQKTMGVVFGGEVG